MDETIICLSNPLDCQLEKIHAPFKEVSRETFGDLQCHLKRLRSMVYRTTDIELPNGDSEVTFYSLCYIKRNLGTRYFMMKSVFVVLPDEFLADNEEAKIIQWLTKNKASFFKQQRVSAQHVNQASKMPPANLRLALTEYERQEVEECSNIFLQMNDNKLNLILDIDSDTDLPNFSLGFDFLSDCN